MASKIIARRKFEYQTKIGPNAAEVDFIFDNYQRKTDARASTFGS